MKKSYLGMIKDMVFPPRCPVCGDIISYEDRAAYREGEPSYRSFVHKECFDKLPFITSDYCIRCGANVSRGEAFCEGCRLREPPFDEGRSVFIYSGAARDAIIKIKYMSKKEYCDFFAYAAWERLGAWMKSKEPDCIVPVPVHKKRRRERGYNQAEELALRIGEYLDIPVIKDALIRVKNTEAQKELGKLERKLNLAEAFDMAYTFEKGLSVLLIDDILTTGITMELCSLTLKEKGGAARVYAVSMSAARAKDSV